jgi:aryl-alcohol dehydrogenase-like predicted oxidoreductase
MGKHKCKTTGIELSVLGAGCWAYGGGDYWGKQDQEDVTDVVHASVDWGINYFDTAEAYNEGRSESSLGEAIRGIPRDKIVIGTKVSTSNCYKGMLVEHCEASLKRLQTDYIDIYMIHWPIHPRSIMHFSNDRRIIQSPPTIEEALDALRTLKECGKIREFGVSNFSKNRLNDFSLSEITVNELPYNLLCRAIEYDTLPFCEEQGIGVIGYMAMLQGILADIYLSLDDVPVWQRRIRHFNSKNNPECRHGESGAENETNTALKSIREICDRTGYTMPEIAVKWILGNPAITCTLVGSRNTRELEANVKAIQEPLSEDIKAELDHVTSPLMEKLGNHFDYYESAENDRTI